MRVEPLAVVFDDRASPDGPTATTIRPGRELRDAEHVQLHNRGAPDSPGFIELCHVEATTCAVLADTYATHGEVVVDFAVPQVVAPDVRGTEQNRMFACTPDRCRLRLVTDQRVAAVADVRFDTDEEHPHRPEQTLDPSGVQVPGTRVVLHGRRFDVPRGR